ncbi:MAG: SUMF1/EgtB/PvdO family nonheme iron enzyme [Planctomycetaceae bacterium]
MACRAGTTTTWNCGTREEELKSFAVYSLNSNSRTQPAGTKLPNGFGLFDIHGNVWESGGEITPAPAGVSSDVERSGRRFFILSFPRSTWERAIRCSVSSSVVTISSADRSYGILAREPRAPRSANSPGADSTPLAKSFVTPPTTGQEAYGKYMEGGDVEDTEPLSNEQQRVSAWRGLTTEWLVCFTTENRRSKERMEDTSDVDEGKTSGSSPDYLVGKFCCK